MKKEMPGKCPVCGGRMGITAIRCSECDIKIEGAFEPCRFCRLTEVQKDFAEVFLKNRGNIREIEKELGISYPTVRNRLEDVISALGHTPPDPVDSRKKQALDDLSSGKITVEDALKMMKEGK